MQSIQEHAPRPVDRLPAPPPQRTVDSVRVGGGAVHRPARRDIEGLRAIAVTLVLVVHAGLPPSGGFVGVDIFFVISGFLMTSILLKELLVDHRISLSAFYARRARRLLPAATTVIVFVGIATLTLIPRIRWLDVGKDMVASALFVQNWRLASVATDYNAQGLAKSPLQHFWSLAVEEQYYFLWPVLLLLATALIRRRRATAGTTRQTRGVTAAMAGAIAVLGLPSLYWSLHLTASNADAAYFVTTTRLWELAVGGGVAILAVYIPKILPGALAAVLGWAGLALLVGSAFVITDATPFPGSAALGPTLGTALVIGAGTVSTRVGPAVLLGVRPLQWVGKLSYSLYLWHWPLLVIVAARVGSLSRTQGVIVVLASVVPAYLSFRLVEDPLRRSAKVRASANRGLGLGGLCLVGSMVLAAVVVGATWPPPAPPAPIVITLGPDSDGSPGRSPMVGALVLGDDPRHSRAGAITETSESIMPDPIAAPNDVDRVDCIGTLSETSPRACVLGDEGSHVNVALVGDSHAAQLIKPMANIASSRGWRLTIFVKQSCELAKGIVHGYNGRPYPACSAWNAAVQRDLAKLRPAAIFVTSLYRPLSIEGKRASTKVSFNVTRDAFQAAWRQATAAGGVIIGIHDTPKPIVDEPTCVSENETALGECAFSRSSGVPSSTPLRAAIDATPGASWVDVDDWICPRTQCAPVIGNVLVYRDDNHLTSTYAATLAPALDAAIPEIGG